MHSSLKRSGAAFLAAVLACGMMTGCGNGKKEEKFDGTKTLVSVNGDDLTLGAVNFFAKAEQAQMYNFYTYYYGMQGQQLFDMVFDSETGETYGDSMKEGLLEQLEKDLLLKAKAADYNVSLTAEEQAEIDRVAQATMDANTDEVKASLGMTLEDIKTILELETLRSKMMEPLAADVDTNIADADAQQTSFTYVKVAIPEASDEADSAAESIASAADVEEVAAASDAESVLANVDVEAVSATAGEVTSDVEAASGVESVVEAVVEPETKEALAAKAEAQKVLDAAIAAGADCDLSEVAKTIDEALYSLEGQFTTNDLTDTYADANAVAAAAGLSDGAFVDHPVLNADGNAYYVIRVDKVFDEDKTAEKKDEILSDRKQELYDSTVQEWFDAAEIKVDDAVFALVKLDDKNLVTLKAPEDTADSLVDLVESAVEPAESSVTDVESVAENTVSVAE